MRGDAELIQQAETSQQATNSGMSIAYDATPTLNGMVRLAVAFPGSPAQVHLLRPAAVLESVRAAIGQTDGGGDDHYQQLVKVEHAMQAAIDEIERRLAVERGEG